MRNQWEGRWHNQWGSELHLEVDDSGRLGGSLLTGGEKRERFPLTGFVRGDLIAFSVDFGKHGTMTSWVGHAFARDHEVRIETLWHMTVNMPHPGRAEERWQSIHTGSDVFTRGPAAAIDRPKRMPPQPLWLT